MKKVKLIDICNPKQWATISTDKLLRDGYPVYGANGRIGYYDKYNHQYPTLLITCRGATCGTINISEPKSYINGNAMCLDDLHPDILLKYLYYQLLNYNFKEVISGSAQPQITREGLAKVWLNIHSLEEQKAIAEKLDKVSGLIEKRKTQLEKLDLLIKSRFIEMFGNPVSNDKGWQHQAMDRVAPSSACLGDNSGTVWLLNLDMVEAQTGRILDYLYVEKEQVGTSTCAFDEGNVLYSKLRPYLNKVVVPTKKGYCTTELVPLRPNGKLNRQFLAYLLRSEAFVSFINEKVAGAKMPRVSMSVFRDFECILPPIDLQNEFAAFVEQIDKSKFEIQKSLEKLEILKKSLMQQYFG